MRKIFQKALVLTVCLCAISIVSCSDDEETLKMPDITMKAGDTYTIESGMNWLSADPLIATISSNTIHALRVGHTKISNNTSSFNLTVTPKYDLYDDPCMQWGASPSKVNTFMKGYTMLEQDENIVFYSGNGVAEMYAYYFEKEKLTSSLVLLEAEKYYSTLHAFLAERYEFLGQDEEDYSLYYISMDKKLAIMVELYDFSGAIYAGVMYFPYEEDATKIKSQKKNLNVHSNKIGLTKNIATSALRNLNSFKLK